jgi:ABC transporter ATM
LLRLVSYSKPDLEKSTALIVFPADMIIVLKEGEVVEQGTHEELLRARGLYYSMWQQQASLEAAQAEEIEADEAITLVAEERSKEAPQK